MSVGSQWNFDMRRQDRRYRQALPARVFKRRHHRFSAEIRRRLPGFSMTIADGPEAFRKRGAIRLQSNIRLIGALVVRAPPFMPPPRRMTPRLGPASARKASQPWTADRFRPRFA
jgi:hypothetical protein